MHAALADLVRPPLDSRTTAGSRITVGLTGATATLNRVNLGWRRIGWSSKAEKARRERRVMPLEVNFLRIIVRQAAEKVTWRRLQRHRRTFRGTGMDESAISFRSDTLLPRFIRREPVRGFSSAAKVKTQPALNIPRLALRNMPTVFSRLNTPSIRFCLLWPTWSPACRVVRPSMALQPARFAFSDTCGVAFRSRVSRRNPRVS